MASLFINKFAPVPSALRLSKGKGPVRILQEPIVTVFEDAEFQRHI
jgi:hypothetical protein